MAMNPGMKMMLMQRSVERGKESSEYGGGRRMIGYDRENNGNAAISNYGESYGGMGTQNRRQRDSRGRYMEGGGWEGNGYSGGGAQSAYNEGSYGVGGEYVRMTSYGAEPRRQRNARAKPMMDDDEDETQAYSARMMGGNSYGDIYAKGTLYAPGAMNKPKGMHGRQQEEDFKPVDEQQARKWVKKMTYTEHDGGEERYGEKFPTNITEQIRKMICPECKPWEFYVAMNAMYADYCKVAKSSGVDKPEFYGRLAEAFLCDEDAGEHKLQKYMEYIPE